MSIHQDDSSDGGESGSISKIINMKRGAQGRVGTSMSFAAGGEENSVSKKEFSSVIEPDGEGSDDESIARVMKP